MNAPFSFKRKPETGTNKIDGIRDIEAFAFILLRERARVERAGGSLCLVLFAAREQQVDLVNTLLAILVRRKRITDEVGWFDADHIGVLLSATEPRGARAMAEDVCSRLPQRMDYRIYTYPSQVSPDRRQEEIVDQKGRQWGICCASVLDLESLVIKKPSCCKRGLDILGSTAGLLVLCPLFFLVAFYVQLVSRGPVFYRQERIGRGGHRFMLLKFRSMKRDADTTVHAEHLQQLLQSDAPMVKLDAGHDPRIIPLGRLMRWSCIDELPQLINVLKGEMSLVGPRPCLPYEADQYQIWQTRRFDVLPGMTGLWQVSGKNRVSFKEMVRLDIRYATRLSLLQDFRILMRTLPVICGQILELVQRPHARRVHAFRASNLAAR
ncbi:MAG: sugar transferase [Acidobacteria bacterium]|nr:MAG: sugar transferase [Acidobacteriota bacterium]